MDISGFQNSIFALASDAAIQDALFPSFAAKGDELVIEFGDWLESVNLSFFTTEQQLAIKRLDDFIIGHSGEAFSVLYTDNSQLYKNEYCAEVRRLACELINEMHWQYKIPQPPNAIYVGRNT